MVDSELDPLQDDWGDTPRQTWGDETQDFEVCSCALEMKGEPEDWAPCDRCGKVSNNLHLRDIDEESPEFPAVLVLCECCAEMEEE